MYIKDIKRGGNLLLLGASHPLISLNPTVKWRTLEPCVCSRLHYEMQNGNEVDATTNSECDAIVAPHSDTIESSGPPLLVENVVEER